MLTKSMLGTQSYHSAEDMHCASALQGYGPTMSCCTHQNSCCVPTSATNPLQLLGGHTFMYEHLVLFAVVPCSEGTRG